MLIYSVFVSSQSPSVSWWFGHFPPTWYLIVPSTAMSGSVISSVSCGSAVLRLLPDVSSSDFGSVCLRSFELMSAGLFSLGVFSTWLISIFRCSLGSTSGAFLSLIAVSNIRYIRIPFTIGRDNAVALSIDLLFMHASVSMIAVVSVWLKT